MTGGPALRFPRGLALHVLVLAALAAVSRAQFDGGGGSASGSGTAGSGGDDDSVSAPILIFIVFAVLVPLISVMLKLGSAQIRDACTAKHPRVCGCCNGVDKALLEACGYNGHRCDAAAAAARLDLGVYVDRRERATHRTPLMFAAERGGADVVDLLLERGADVNVVDHDEDSALHLAALPNREAGDGVDDAEYVRIVRALLVHKADIDMEDAKGQTPLMRACKCPDSSAAGKVEALLDAGASITAQCGTVFGFTPLHFAVSSGQEDVVRALVQRGADVHAVTTDTRRVSVECTPVYLAVTSQKGTRASRLRMLQALLSAGARVRGPNVMSALNADADEEVLSTLLEACDDLAFVDEAGDTLTHRACTVGRVDVLKTLVTTAGAAPVDARDQNGMTPLHHAADNVHAGVEFFEVLRDAGADATIEADDTLGTPLAYLCQMEEGKDAASNRDVVQIIVLLLRAGSPLPAPGVWPPKWLPEDDVVACEREVANLGREATAVDIAPADHK